MAIAMDEEIRNIRRLLDVARGKQFPVVHTTVVYTEEHFRDGGWFIKKIPSLEVLRPGSKESQIVPELAPRSGELVLEKRFPPASTAPTSTPTSRPAGWIPLSSPATPRAAACAPPWSTRSRRDSAW